MEGLLIRDGLFPYRSVACSLGGIIDTRGGIDGTGIEAGRAAIRRNGVVYLDEGGVKSVTAEVERRMSVWTREMDGHAPAVFVNVGGSQTALGADTEAAGLPAGLLTGPVHTVDPDRGTIARMRERGVPVVHLLGIRALARRFGIPVDSGIPGSPPAPVSLERRTRSVPLAVFWLALLGVLLVRASANPKG